jgi:hypothetical protein
MAMKTNDTLLLMLPDDMQPLAFREELCSLDGTLRVVLDHEPHEALPLARVVDEEMAVQMSEYILTAVLLFKRRFLEYAQARGSHPTLPA